MKNSAKQNDQPYWRKNSSLHFSTGLVLSLILVLTAFEWNFRNELTDRPIEIPEDPMNEVDLVVVDEPIPARPKVPVSPIIQPTIPSEPKESKVEIISTPEPTPTVDIPDLGKLFGDEPPMGREKTEEPVYDLISAQPEGGMETFYQYLYENISYPNHLVARGMTGKVFVQFDIDPNGNIVNVKILKGFDKELETEIIRVLKNAPAWVPAQRGNDKVQTQLKIPFAFDLR